MSLYLNLFWSFFKIGLFGFGGGYAMLPLIQDEVVNKNQWLTSTKFTDIIAISQMTPGPIAINSATYVGYTATGSVWGSVLATFSVCLPSFIIMLLLCKFFFTFRNNKYIKDAFLGLKPAVIGLILAAAITLLNGENFIDYKSVLLFAGAFALSASKKMNPIYIIIIAGVFGYVLY